MSSQQAVPDVPVIGLSVLRQTPGWADAMKRLEMEWDEHGAAARERAERIRGEFAGRRGTMVLNVVLSRQRRYESHVEPRIARWCALLDEQGGAQTLHWLVAHGELVSAPHLPLRRGEADTILNVARALLRYGADHGLDDEDAACGSWAAAVTGLELAPKLDPYVGAVSGIGAALFAYVRMLCGADTVKPDVRVLRSLRRLGVDLPADEAAAGFVAVAFAAHELQVPVLELDQLLWLATPSPAAKR